MMAKETTGMGIMAGAGLLVSGMVMVSAIAKDNNFPYLAIMGTGSSVLCLALAVSTSVFSDLRALSQSQWTWCLFRGFCGTTAHSLHIMAILAGAPMGDVSALQSINVVVAAVLGRVFLGEPLRAPHIVALVTGVAGAGLLSKPESLLGSADPGSSEVPWLGYVCGLVAGILIGANFIAARKSVGIPAMCMMFSVFLQEAIVFWGMVLTGLFHQAPVSTLMEETSAIVLMCAGISLGNLFATLMLNEGGRLCPAAASSTIFTSVNMSCSYLAQIQVQGQIPEMLTMVGAALMLIAVALMAFARWLYTETASGSSCSASGQGSDAVLPPEANDAVSSEGIDVTLAEESDNESLASFIASEFSGCSSKEKISTRQRRVIRAADASAVFAAAHAIGAGSA